MFAINYKELEFNSGSPKVLTLAQTLKISESDTNLRPVDIKAIIKNLIKIYDDVEKFIVLSHLNSIEIYCNEVLFFRIYKLKIEYKNIAVDFGQYCGEAKITNIGIFESFKEELQELTHLTENSRYSTSSLTYHKKIDINKIKRLYYFSYYKKDKDYDRLRNAVLKKFQRVSMLTNITFSFY